MPSRGRVAIEEARKWARDGIISDDQLARIEQRYAGSDGGGRQLLIGIGVALFAIAVGTLVMMTFEDTAPLLRMVIVLAAAAVFVGVGLYLRPRSDLRRLGGALVATAGPLWVLSWVVGGEGIDGTSIEPVALGILVLGSAAIWGALWNRFPGGSFAGHLSLGIALLVMVGMFLDAGADEATWTTVGYTVSTWVLLGVLESSKRTRRPWMPWSLGALAVIWVPAAFMWSFELFHLMNWGAAGVLALGGTAAIAHGLLREIGPLSAGGALTMSVAAVFLGASEGEVWGTVIALVAVGAAFVAAGQLKPGWWRPRGSRR